MLQLPVKLSSSSLHGLATHLSPFVFLKCYWTTSSCSGRNAACTMLVYVHSHKFRTEAVTQAFCLAHTHQALAKEAALGIGILPHATLMLNTDRLVQLCWVSQ